MVNLSVSSTEHNSDIISSQTDIENHQRDRLITHIVFDENKIMEGPEVIMCNSNVAELFLC